MPLRHPGTIVPPYGAGKNTKIHKEQTINALNLVSSLSLRAFVAIQTFWSGLKVLS
jgi:hypothetical protein